MPTLDEKLAAILAVVQVDPGQRGLARIPGDNLFTATAGDFQAACRSLAEHPRPDVAIQTGFYIAAGMPPAFETDGPLGAVFLWRALNHLQIPCSIHAESGCVANWPQALGALLSADAVCAFEVDDTRTVTGMGRDSTTHFVSVERAGPGPDGRCYSMRGRDITDFHDKSEGLFQSNPHICTIGIGDGGNEIGMGKIPHDTIVKNIPGGELIHCVVPVDHLIVAGVSNWGVYALAAGVLAIRGVAPPADLFDPETELHLLDVMVRTGPLIDGVTRLPTATVDGLHWDDYTKPLRQIRAILES